jgi:hypothetical protein
MLSNYVSYLFRPSANQIEHFLRQKNEESSLNTSRKSGEQKKTRTYKRK